MSKSKSARPSGSGTSGRPSGSSLTDAVVAALAEVEKSQGEIRVPPEAKAEKPGDKDDNKKAAPAAAAPEKKREDTASFERGDATQKTGGAGEPAKAEPAKTETAKTETAKTETAKTEQEPPSVEYSYDKTLEDSGPPAGAAVTTSPTAIVGAPPKDGASAAPATDRNETTVETKAPEEKTLEEKAPEEKTTEKVALLPDGAPAGAASTSGPPEAAKEAPKEPKPTPKGIAVDYFGRTDVGLVREHNEDNFLVVDLQAQKRGVGAAILHTRIEGAGSLFAVCDGMGGAAAGEVASQMAVDTIHEMMQNGGAPRDRDHFARRLVRSIEEAGSRIFAAAKMDRSRRGMGTTSTVAGLIDQTLFVGQVGDSRAYVLRHVPGGEDQFALITKDQSLVNQLIEAGQLTEEEAEAFEHSNIILQALGTTEEVTVDLTFLELRRGDRLLMCSDGLSGLVHGDMIKEVVRTSRDLIECANQLIAMANAGGGHDNITVVLAEFDGEDLKVASADEKVRYQQYPLPPEDPKDPDPVPRATAIKSGGPKPGSDVKHEGARVASPTTTEAGGGNRALLVGVLIVVVILVGIAVMLFSGDAHSAPPESRTTTLSHGRGASGDVPNLHVLSNVEGATLYVDGVSRGALVDGMHVTVDPGTHHVEARRGGEVAASADVSARTGGVVVSLIADEAPLPPTDVSVAATPPVSEAPIPGGADVPDETPPPTGETP